MGQARLEGLKPKLVLAVAVGTSLYHFLFVAGIFQRAGLYIHSAQHFGVSLGTILLLVFLVYSARGEQHKERIPWYDMVLGIAVVVSCFYHLIFPDLILEHYLDSTPTALETLFAIILVILLMEAVRRVIGIAMPILAALFVIYVFTCGGLPGLMRAIPIDLSEAVAVFYLGDSGIFGMIVRVYSTVIFPFVIFSSFFQASGATNFFINLAMSLAGAFRGGPAKVAIVSSAFFGTISGAPPANVATTGAVTIPLMKRLGFRPEFAGAVEAVASNGGAITPPVMAVVAFLMAEVIGVPYAKVCIAALLPALLYFTALFAAVHMETLRIGVEALPRDELPSLKQTLKEGWQFLLPIGALVFFLVVLRMAAEAAAIYSILVVLIVSMFRRESRMGPRRVISGLDNAARTMLYVGPACGLIGVILGAINASGIGVTITGAIVDIAGGNITVLLVLTAALCFLLGMGTGPIIIYMVLAALVAPSLERMGVPKMSAHLFILYWGLVSLITPPVCVSSFVAAGIAGARPMATGWQATRLGIVTFIIPFFFVYSPVLLLEGAPSRIALAIATGVIGVCLLSTATIGYLFRSLTWYQRVAALISALLLLYPGWPSDLAGLALAILVLLPQLKSVAATRFSKGH